MTVKAICSRCQRELILYSGIGELPRPRKFQLLVAKGWDVAPVILCRDCACPLSDEDKNHFGEITNYMHIENFVRKMRKKYGSSVNKFFQTTP